MHFGNIPFEVRVLFKLRINTFSVTTMTMITINVVLEQCILIECQFPIIRLTFGARDPGVQNTFAICLKSTYSKWILCSCVESVATLTQTHCMWMRFIGATNSC